MGSVCLGSVSSFILGGISSIIFPSGFPRLFLALRSSSLSLLRDSSLPSELDVFSLCSGREN